MRLSSPTPPDPCRYKRFYVDNLVIIGDGPDELCNLYAFSRKTLAIGVVQAATLQLCVGIQDMMAHILRHHGTDWRCCGIGTVPSLTRNVSFTLNAILMLLQRKNLLLKQQDTCLSGRILLSELWEEGLRWDEHIPQEFSSRWKILSSDLSGLVAISFLGNLQLTWADTSCLSRVLNSNWP